VREFRYPCTNEWAAIVERPVKPRAHLQKLMSEISSEIQEDGDLALLELTQRYDRIDLNRIKVDSQEIATRARLAPRALRTAIKQAIANIRHFHQSQNVQEDIVETLPGVRCWRRSVAIDRVGLYVPGGTAPLFSSLLMLAVPAQIVACPEIVVCTPPDSSGQLSEVIALAAELLGIESIYLVGGAQAVLAMALGTKTVPKVDKIFGPGNQYVNAAKEYVSSQLGVAIDLPAGPSELLVIADDGASAQFIAADLLSQAEHGEDSQVILVTDSEKLLGQVNQEVLRQLSALPRAAVVAKALENGRLVLVKNLEEAINLSNRYAPEHLILAVRSPEEISQMVKNAGSVFLGDLTAEAFGDYASGTNHTLPTNGAARAYSGVSLDSFVKKITYQEISSEGLIGLGKSVEILAEAEGLQGHKESISIRLLLTRENSR